MQPPSLTEIAVVTSNRLNSLRRCLVSYARHCEAMGRHCAFTVFDDTTPSGIRKTSREWLIAFGRKHRVDVSYADLQSKRTFADQMQAEGIPRSTLDFALEGCPSMRFAPGRNRNATLMHFVDEEFFCSDDDAFCRPSDFRHGDQSVNVLTQGSFSLDTHFFSSRREAFEAAPIEACDVLAAHETLLGRSFKQLPWSASSMEFLRRASGRLDLDSSGTTDTVSVTVSGVVGDSGIPNQFGFMLNSGPIRERFLEAMRTQGAICISRNIVRGVCRPSVTPMGLVFTVTGTGFDNRNLLPPFVPSGGGEDTLFGYMLGLCNSHSFSAHIPVGLAHDPSSERVYKDLQLAPNLVHLIIKIFGSCAELPEHSAEERMQAVGRYLQEVAQADAVTFLRLVKDISQQIVQSWIEWCTYALTQYDNQPTSWAETMQRWLAELQYSLDRHPCISMQGDFDAPYGSAEVLQIVQQYLLDYALLLQAWPDMIAAARDLRQRDCRIASKVSSKK